ncbi:heparan-alpha-glucosaminide N-acetyltransferase domain-containing protein [Kineosporia babensis]|uniref:Heparan-alpha-glucosaminide N-acetyltransferase domain-containing protein n=1 Tax=Kineosporia babensis TaxID=499548 RepID=A0A9X1SVP1_9ACTN|nr:heparan-alpha-glucosaminide N-acetyltransferase domain-containing protein [Kineosporia babensis]
MVDTSTAAGKGTRLTGIDVARSFALFGMMATHILTGPGSDEGAMGAIHEAAGGRAAALFAVLAGAGLALASGGDRPTPEKVSRTRRTTLVRSVALVALGLTLGMIETPVAIILAYYGLLFLVAIPVLQWRARSLTAAAVAAALATPVVSYWLRGDQGLEESAGDNLEWSSLGEFAHVVRHLLLTGYYPVLTWTAYLFAGLAVGRLALRDQRVAALVAGIGAALAAGAWAVSTIAVRAAGGFGALIDNDLLTRYSVNGRTPNDGFYGTSPVNDPWWLLVRIAHSGSITDLVHTIGTSMLVLGLTLLAVRPIQRVGRVPLRMLAAAGSMTLTLYCLHVVAVGLNSSGFGDPLVPVWPFLVLNIVGAVVIALLWGAPDRRGPVEDAIAITAGAATRDQR